MNKDNMNNGSGRTLYQLWGHDTFSNELYRCGIYRHRSSAYRAKRKHEEDVTSYQSEGLRDTFWVSAITEAEYEKQLISRQKTIEIKHRLLEENQKFIEDNCAVIYDALVKVANKEIKLPRKNEVRQIELVEVPNELLIESIYLYLSKFGRKHEFCLGISTKECEYTERDGATTCYICTGTMEDFRDRVTSSISKEWINQTLGRIIEKDIYETI